MSSADQPSSPLELLRPIVWAQAQAGAGWLRDRDLSQQQAFILRFLSEHPGAIQRELAAATRTTAANVSGVVRGLESRGLVARSAEDERSKRVHATEAGIALISGHARAMADADEQILAPLSAADREHLLQLLDAIAAQLPSPSPSPTPEA